MKFEAVPKETIYLDPRDNLARKSIASQVRRDPLTGKTARIRTSMTLKWVKPDFDKLVGGTEKTCPFCPDKVLKVTPSFPEDLFPEGRLVSGDLVLFPNLAPYDGLSAVVTLGGQHFVPMTEFGPTRLVQGFSLALDYFRRLQALGHPESVYHLITWNYMPPAGSSIIHPHLQVFATSTPPNLMREELEAAKIYWEKTGTNYWDDLVKAETELGERFIGAIGRTAWLAAYAPQGVAGDVLAVVPGVRTTLELTDRDLFDLADGLTRSMKCFDRIGLFSFNAGFFTGAAGDDHARFHVLLSPRSYFNQALGASDVAALRGLYQEGICLSVPEDLTKTLQNEFQVPAGGA